MKAVRMSTLRRYEHGGTASGSVRRGNMNHIHRYASRNWYYSFSVSSLELPECYAKSRAGNYGRHIYHYSMSQSRELLMSHVLSRGA